MYLDIRSKIMVWPRTVFQKYYGLLKNNFELKSVDKKSVCLELDYFQHYR
jgi:hypothetical protein